MFIHCLILQFLEIFNTEEEFEYYKKKLDIKGSDLTISGTWR